MNNEINDFQQLFVIVTLFFKIQFRLNIILVRFLQAKFQTSNSTEIITNKSISCRRQVNPINSKFITINRTNYANEFRGKTLKPQTN